jgi:hypothetical protein
MYKRAVLLTLAMAGSSVYVRAEPPPVKTNPTTKVDPKIKLVESDAFHFTVQCSLVYLSDMNDMNTVKQEAAGTLTVTSATLVRGFAPLTKQSHGFKASVSLTPLVNDDTTFAHGFDVTIQLGKGEATSYGSTYADTSERFRRLSVIIGLGKEQVTANCDIVPQPSKP